MPTSEQKLLVEQIIANFELEKVSVSSISPRIQSGHREAIHLFPILPTSTVDDLLHVFGSTINSREKLIDEGVFPAALSTSGSASTNGFYPNLILDLLALQARKPNSKLVHGLKDQIEALQATPLFKNMLTPLEKPLAGKMNITLSELTELFRPTVRFETMVDHQLPTFDYFGQLSYDIYLQWYEMAQLQAILRQQFFSTGNIFSLTSKLVADFQPIGQITTGLVDGKSQVKPAACLVILTYKMGEGPLESWAEEEVHIAMSVLVNLGCDWPDAPVARIEVTPAHERYYSSHTFYLPALHDPAFIRGHHECVARLKALATSPFGETTGFERPWSNEMFLEILEELKEMEEEENEEDYF
jgi:hypothetical protein